MLKKPNTVFSSASFPVIVASSDSDIKVRAFKCKDSGVSVISNYSASPFSPISGGKLVPVDNKLLTLTASEIKSFESLGECPSCHATLRAHESLAKNLEDTKIYCVVCGEELLIEESGNPEEYLDKLQEGYDKVEEEGKQPELTTLEADLDSIIEEAIQETNSMPETSTQVPVEENDDEEIVVEIIGSEDSEMDEDPIVTEELNEEILIPEETEAGEETETEEEILPQEDLVEHAEVTEEEIPEEVMVPVEEVAEEKEKCKEEEEIRVDMLAKVQANIKSQKIQLVASGKDTFHYVMVSNKPVATLHKSRASSEVKEIFDDKDLVEEVLESAIEKEGLCKSVMSTFGLVPMILKVKASEVVEKAIKEKEEEFNNKLEEEKDKVEEEYQQSLGMASVGINKNLFADVKNVLAEDLVEDLEAIGLEDAREIVESCFARRGEDYLRTIVAKASEFKSKTSDVRNELANTILASNFKSGGLNLNHKAVASVESRNAQINQEDVEYYKNVFFSKNK